MPQATPKCCERCVHNLPEPLCSFKYALDMFERQSVRVYKPIFIEQDGDRVMCKHFREDESR